MRPLFAIDITADKKNTVPNGKEFITRSATPTLTPMKSKRLFKVRTYTRKRQMLPLRILRWLLLLMGVGIFTVVAYNTVLIGFVNYYAESKSLVWCGVGAVALSGIIFLLSLFNRRKSAPLSKSEIQRRTALHAVDDVYAKLGVPPLATDVDVLSFTYKLVNGEPRLTVPSTQYTDFINLSMRIYVKEGKLCLADLANVYSFDLSTVKKIIKIEKTATFPYWNKEDRPNDARFSPFKIGYRYGIFKVKPYYLLLIRAENIDYGIYFPSYELMKFEKLTGLKAAQ